MAHYNFRKDLVDGAEGQDAVVTFLTEQYNGELCSSNNTNSHDVIIQFNDAGPLGKGNISLEIKTDLLITPKSDTGNMFIEVESRGKASGVEVCKAEWFVYYLKHFGEIWIIRTQELLKLIREKNFRSVYGGDKGSGTRGVLIPRNKNKEHFIVLNM